MCNLFLLYESKTGIKWVDEISLLSLSAIYDKSSRNSSDLMRLYKDVMCDTSYWPHYLFPAARPSPHKQFCTHTQSITSSKCATFEKSGKAVKVEHATLQGPCASVCDGRVIKKSNGWVTHGMLVHLSSTQLERRVALTIIPLPVWISEKLFDFPCFNSCDKWNLYCKWPTWN